MSTEEVRTVHPSFGQISIARRQGDSNLFGVDFPTGHSITLEITHAEHIRAHGSDRYHSLGSIINIEMSEVQWSRLLCSPNTQGMPCTIRRMWIDGQYRGVPEFADHEVGAKGNLARKEVEDRAAEALKGVSAARAKLSALLERTGTIGKGELRKVMEELQTAERMAISNLPYIVQRAHETIDEATNHGKAEIEAYLGFATNQLGQRAFAAAAKLAIERGEDPTAYLLAPPVDQGDSK